MSNNTPQRMSRDEIRAIMLANAKVLMSEKYATSAPEVSGERKPAKSKQRSA